MVHGDDAQLKEKKFPTLRLGEGGDEDMTAFAIVTMTRWTLAKMLKRGLWACSILHVALLRQLFCQPNECPLEDLLNTHFDCFWKRSGYRERASVSATSNRLSAQERKSCSHNPFFRARSCATMYQDQPRYMSPCEIRLALLWKHEDNVSVEEIGRRLRRDVSTLWRLFKDPEVARGVGRGCAPLRR